MTRLERLILRSAPVHFLLKKSQHIVLPGFRGLPLYDVGDHFLKQLKKIGLYERASAISFNLIMALPAALMFLVSLVSFFVKSDKIRDDILLGLFRNVTPNKTTYGFISDILQILDQQNVSLVSFGFILLIFYSSNAMMGVIRTFDKSIQEKKAIFFHRRMRALRLTFILMILVLVASLALFFGSKNQMDFLLKNLLHMKNKSREGFYGWWGYVRWAIVVAVLYYGIALVYKFAPSINKKWKLLSAGAVLATGLTLITTIIFSYWVNNFASYNKIYGSIGTVLILMILIYINSLILIIGFELNVSITYLTRAREKAATGNG
ncbi:YihY/virulence factor BrkB family protein [Sediminibacterium roseum]|uniref:YihY/virulence factor BrkB family protein n=1 Tax=Sediminibacterium roseum TaxID=1978412 RepID=A0ABW9ZS61_9BACT|nr:YihY/virulence factor BrkB family protein [Sediminibacterium roseum]NCI49930.1 YihY/virulence factor BrkB family protein [Sediminibacterium roseum]